MITDKDIDNLAELSRLEIGNEEKAGYAKDLNSILAYVAEIQKIGKIAGEEKLFDIQTINTMREDVVTTETGSFTESLIKAAPNQERDYVKVKKIL